MVHRNKFNRELDNYFIPLGVKHRSHSKNDGLTKIKSGNNKRQMIILAKEMGIPYGRSSETV